MKQRKKCFRLSIEAGGCSGFQYNFLLDDKTTSDDRIYEKDGVKLVVDKISLDFIKSLTVDYVEEVIRSAFQIHGLVNVDFADVRASMANAGSSLIRIGTATGKTRARDAALNAIQSPLLDIGIERATGIVWNVTGGSDLTLFEISITLIATGFKRQEESNGRPLQASQLGQADLNRRSFTDSSSVDIPEFLRKIGISKSLNQFMSPLKKSPCFQLDVISIAMTLHSQVEL